MLNNKKAQIGEAITWTAATLILIAILLIFIYASIILSGTKSFESPKEVSSDASVDWIEAKTILAYTLNDENKMQIQKWIGGMDDE